MNKIQHASDSATQRNAESAVISLLQERLGCTLASTAVTLNDGVIVQIDGFNRECRLLCEVYSRIGTLKGSQPDKLASDMLKLVLAERQLGGTWRKILCLADPLAAKPLQGRSWLAAAARTMGFEVVVVPLTSELRESIVSAQGRQKMVNAGNEQR